MKLSKVLFLSLAIAACSYNVQGQSLIGYGQAVISLNSVANGVQNGTAFALPQTTISFLTWCTSYGTAPATATINLQVSNDNTTYSTYDTHSLTTSTCRGIFTSARFVRATISVETGGTTTTVNFVVQKVGPSQPSASVRMNSAGTTLTGGTVLNNSPLVDGTQTWNNAADTFTGVRYNFTNTASGAASLLFDFQLGGSSILNLNRFGLLTNNGPISIGNTNAYIWNGRTRFQSSADSVLEIDNNAATFGLQLNAGTAAPTVNTCGTGTITAGSRNGVGQITATGATACTVAFGTGAWTNAPFCFINNRTAARGNITATSTTAFTISNLTAADVVDYFCIGRI